MRPSVETFMVEYEKSLRASVAHLNGEIIPRNNHGQVSATFTYMPKNSINAAAFKRRLDERGYFFAEKTDDGEHTISVYNKRECAQDKTSIAANRVIVTAQNGEDGEIPAKVIGIIVQVTRQFIDETADGFFSNLADQLMIRTPIPRKLAEAKANQDAKALLDTIADIFGDFE